MICVQWSLNEQIWKSWSGQFFQSCRVRSGLVLLSRTRSCLYSTANCPQILPIGYTWLPVFHIDNIVFISQRCWLPCQTFCIYLQLAVLIPFRDFCVATNGMTELTFIKTCYPMNRVSLKEEMILYGDCEHILKGPKSLGIVWYWTQGSLSVHHVESTGIQVRASKGIRQGQRPKNPDSLHSNSIFTKYVHFRHRCGTGKKKMCGRLHHWVC